MRCFAAPAKQCLLTWYLLIEPITTFKRNENCLRTQYSHCQLPCFSTASNSVDTHTANSCCSSTILNAFPRKLPHAPTSSFTKITRYSGVHNAECWGKKGFGRSEIQTRNCHFKLFLHPSLTNSLPHTYIRNCVWAQTKTLTKSVSSWLYRALRKSHTTFFVLLNYILGVWQEETPRAKINKSVNWDTWKWANTNHKCQLRWA